MINLQNLARLEVGAPNAVGALSISSPTEIPGLELWLDASDTGSITHTANSVTQWNDKSGNNYHASQSTSGMRPITNTATMNGLNAIRFDGTDDRLDVSYSGLRDLTGTEDITIIVIYKANTAAHNGRVFCFSNGASPHVSLSHYAVDQRTRYQAFGNEATIVNTPDTDAHMFGLIREGTTLYAKYDADKEVTTTTGDESSTHGPYIGREFNNLNRLDGDIGEILIYNRAITVAEYNAIGVYAGRWKAAGFGFFSKPLAGTNRAQVEGYSGLTPATYTSIESRHSFFTGRYTVENPQFIYPNWGVDGGDKNGPDTVTVQAGYETLTPSATTAIQFAGSNSASLNGGSQVTSDPLSLTLSANTEFKVRSRAEFTLGDQVYYGFFDDEASRFRTDATNQVHSTGALTGGSPDNYRGGYGPLAAIGTLPVGALSIAILDDSRGQGVSETFDTEENHSYITKGLWDITGGGIPYVNYSRSSESLSGMLGETGAKRLAMLQYHNVAIIGFGTNDLGGSPTLQQMKDNYLELWANVRAKGIGHIAQLKILPRTTSETDMTPFNTNFASGGMWTQLNDWFDEKAANGEINSVIDVLSTIQDPVNLHQWDLSGLPTNNPTADGDHLSDYGSDQAKVPVTTWGTNLLNGD